MGQVIQFPNRKNSSKSNTTTSQSSTPSVCHVIPFPNRNNSSKPIPQASKPTTNVLDFPRNSYSRKQTSNLKSNGRTPFRWMGFNSSPALYIDVNTKLADRILANFADFDPPPKSYA